MFLKNAMQTMFIMKGSEHVVLSCVVSVDFFFAFLKI